MRVLGFPTSISTVFCKAYFDTIEAAGSKGGRGRAGGEKGVGRRAAPPVVEQVRDPDPKPLCLLVAGEGLPHAAALRGLKAPHQVSCAKDIPAVSVLAIKLHSHAGVLNAAVSNFRAGVSLNCGGVAPQNAPLTQTLLVGTCLQPLSEAVQRCLELASRPVAVAKAIPGPGHPGGKLCGGGEQCPGLQAGSAPHHRGSIQRHLVAFQLLQDAVELCPAVCQLCGMLSLDVSSAVSCLGSVYQVLQPLHVNRRLNRRTARSRQLGAVVCLPAPLYRGIFKMIPGRGQLALPPERWR
mmetsp:Transcript_6862/g.19348  ORF Transcript_6862/g.19348 Transcript_6862/m.19348 type:complete len:295 (+) Transcript_6862:334-1218(+)